MHKTTKNNTASNDELNRSRRALALGGLSASALSFFGPKRAFADPPIASLPTINVYGSPPTGDAFYGIDMAASSAPMPPKGAPPFSVHDIGAKVVANGKRVFKMAEGGDPIATMDEFFKGLSGRSAEYVWGQIRSLGAFTQWLANGGYSQLIGANSYGLLPAQSSNITMMYGLYFSQHANTPISEFKFYGNPFMPIAAIHYWINGNGADRTIDIPSLNLSMGLNDFSPIKNIVNNLSMGPGSYAIDASFSTNLFAHGTKDLWAAGVIGRISGQVTGTLNIDQAGTYAFNDSYTLLPDVFNADRSHRPFPQEQMTDFLRAIGDLFGHTDYTIKFSGSGSISFSGPR
ncbi:lipid II-degrading bacteriocin [Trinickia dinghuensis]|nr:lipid II-degrading bacteriocin [Trinickia dinghuensis]